MLTRGRRAWISTKLGKMEKGMPKASKAFDASGPTAPAGPERSRALECLEMTRGLAHFSTSVGHAIYILLELMGKPTKSAARTEELAESVQLPIDQVRELLGELAKAGIVLPEAGVAGERWKLSTSPDRISVLAAVEAVQSYRSIFESAEAGIGSNLIYSRPVMRRGFFGLHAIMLEAERKMLDTLAQRTLKDIES